MLILLSLQRRGQLVEPERQLPLEWRVVLQLSQAPERRLPLQHEVCGVRPGHGERVLLGGSTRHRLLCRRQRLHHLRVGQPLGHGGLAEAAMSGEGARVLVHGHGDTAEFVPLLFLLQTDGKSTADRVAQTFALEMEDEKVKDQCSRVE